MPKILVVDDKAAIRDFLAKLLTSRKYTVLQAEDGAEALQMLESERPDLVITDVMMPHVNGYEFVARLRATPHLAGTPVIFLSGHFHEWEARDLGQVYEVAHVLTKPCSPQVILGAVGSCLQHADARSVVHESPGVFRDAAARPGDLSGINRQLEQLVADLTRSEERLRAIVDFTPSMVYLKDTQGRYLLSNRALQAHLGRTSSEIEGKTDFDLFAPEFSERSRHHHEQTIACRRPLEVEEEILHGNETQTWLTTRFPLVDESSGVYAVGGIATDITRLKIHEILLARNASDLENRARLQECIAELSFQALSRMTTAKLLDKAARLMCSALRADYCRVLEISRSGKLTQAAGYGPMTLPGREADPALIPNSLAAHTVTVGAPVLVNELAEETRFDGDSLFMDFGLASAVAVAVEDRRSTWAVLEMFSRTPCFFTEEHVGFLQSGANIIAAAIDRNRAVRDLRSAQSHLSHLISSSPAVIYALNVEGDSLEPNTVGENIERVTGYSVRETLRAEWWHEHTNSEELIRAISNGSAPKSGNQFVREYKLTRADGKTIWLRDECRILVGNLGAPLEIVGSLSDISEQKVLEDQFRRAQKLETFGQLAGGIAHDFNNLLTVISGFAELELANSDLDASARNALETISKAAAGAIGLTRQLVAFSRQQPLSRQVVDLGVVIENLLHMFRRVIGADINLHTDVPTGLPRVDVDTGMVEQILLNLTVNARDAMPKGGDLNISIRATVLRREDVSPGGDRRPGEFVCLEVQDTGCGMNRTTLSRIFEPFFTTKDVGKGTGLGLATVHGIVKQHNGWVEVDSREGKGTTFRIYFPVADAHAEDAEETVSFQDRPPGDATILLVEDEALVRTFTEGFLVKRGYKVLTADCGAAAEKILTLPNTRVDLLMTDIVLPGGISGPELADRLTRLRPGLRVLYTSGYHTRRSAQEPRLEEGLNFVRKPFELSRLAATIENCLTRKQRAASTAA